MIPLGPLNPAHQPLLAYNPHDPSPAGFLLIAGPCVLESLDLALHIASTVQTLAARLNIPYVFKASFDKANRSSPSTSRGLGSSPAERLDKGLAILAAIREKLALPVTTDIHESDQAAPVAHHVDMLQIPAFLCRQTDLLLAAGATGKPVNIKKGQFMAPHEMQNALAKVASTGNMHTLLTERGTFFGYNRLVNDLTSIPQMQALGVDEKALRHKGTKALRDEEPEGAPTHAPAPSVPQCLSALVPPPTTASVPQCLSAFPLKTPVLMDATHSTQLPGQLGHATGGQRHFVPLLAKAATAAGANGLFIEVHPNPDQSPSDAATILPLSHLELLLQQCLAIRAAIA